MTWETVKALGTLPAKVYGVGRAAVGSQIYYISVKDGNDPNNDINDTRMTADLQIALGGGYGSLLDVGGAIRVRRLARGSEVTLRGLHGSTEYTFAVYTRGLLGTRSPRSAPVYAVTPPA